jgi:hypothetical protein
MSESVGQVYAPKFRVLSSERTRSSGYMHMQLFQLLFLTIVDMYGTVGGTR